jgi:hypothetical protein
MKKYVLVVEANASAAVDLLNKWAAEGWKVVSSAAIPGLQLGLVCWTLEKEFSAAPKS